VGTTQHPVQSLDALIGSYGSVRKAAEALGVSIGVAARAAKGQEPRRADLRAALGLPPAIGPEVIVMGTAVECARCGRPFVGRWGTRRRMCPICRPGKKQEHD
jgi:hypothetical protein